LCHVFKGEILWMICVRFYIFHIIVDGWYGAPRSLWSSAFHRDYRKEMICIESSVTWEISWQRYYSCSKRPSSRGTVPTGRYWLSMLMQQY
jgi:hypothetical protein